MAHPSEKTETPAKKAPEKAHIKFKRPQMEELFRKNKELIGRDNDNIYSPTPESQRARAKFWMFKIFREKI